MLNPAPVPRANLYPNLPPFYSKPNLGQQLISANEDMRRLFVECEIGKGNAQLLNQALTYARPDELGGPVIGVRNDNFYFTMNPQMFPLGMVSQVSGFPRFYHGSNTMGDCSSGPIARRASATLFG